MSFSKHLCNENMINILYITILQMEHANVRKGILIQTNILTWKPVKIKKNLRTVYYINIMSYDND